MYTFTIYIITQFIHNILEWFTLEKEFEEVVKKKGKKKSIKQTTLFLPPLPWSLSRDHQLLGP